MAGIRPSPDVVGTSDSSGIPLQPLPSDLSLRETPGQAAAPGDGRIIDLPRTIDVDHAAEEALRRYQVGRRLRSDAEILSARQLHASVYVAKGFVAPEDLAADGTIGRLKDPWPAMSTYFGTFRGDSVTVTARQISLAHNGDLPALGLHGLVSADVSKIRDLPAGDAVEISALASRPGAFSADVVAVYVRMWRESLERRHQAWVMAVDLPLFRHLRNTFCGKAIRPIGPEQIYLGSVVVPATIWCDELGPEQRQMARSPGRMRPLRALLPRLFPPPVGARS